MSPTREEAEIAYADEIDAAWLAYDTTVAEAERKRRMAVADATQRLVALNAALNAQEEAMVNG